MPSEEIGQFMAAIRQLESSNNYGAIGPTHEKYGRALGAYQIMEANWGPWSKAAGVPDADWRDPAAQDYVARFQMLRYYAMFGDWDLVAVAWFAGPGAAVKAQRDGVDSVGMLSDVLGTSVTKYIEMMRANWSDEPDPRQTPSTLERLNTVEKDKAAIARSLGSPIHKTVTNPSQMLRDIFSTLSDGLAGWNRLHIDDVAPNLRIKEQVTGVESATAKVKGGQVPKGSFEPEDELGPTSQRVDTGKLEVI